MQEGAAAGVLAPGRMLQGRAQLGPSSSSQGACGIRGGAEKQRKAWGSHGALIRARGAVGTDVASHMRCLKRGRREQLTGVHTVMLTQAVTQHTTG